MFSVVSASVAFLSTVELATVVFSECVKQRIRTFCQWLKKYYQEFARCLTEEERKPLKLAFFFR